MSNHTLTILTNGTVGIEILSEFADALENRLNYDARAVWHLPSLAEGDLYFVTNADEANGSVIVNLEVFVKLLPGGVERAFRKIAEWMNELPSTMHEGTSLRIIKGNRAIDGTLAFDVVFDAIDSIALRDSIAPENNKVEFIEFDEATVTLKARENEAPEVVIELSTEARIIALEAQAAAYEASLTSMVSTQTALLQENLRLTNENAGMARKVSLLIGQVDAERSAHRSTKNANQVLARRLAKVQVAKSNTATKKPVAKKPAVKKLVAKK